MLKNKTLVGFFLVFFGAVFFSTKAILVKLAYQHPIDPISLLTLRMVFSLPFFIIIGVVSGKKKDAGSMSGASWGKIFLLGIIGYYLASLFDFQGLLYITAGLERLILFVYPTIVVVISAIYYKQSIKRNQYIALVLTYIGIFVVFAFDANLQGQKNVVKGALLIFGSAFTYAMYLFGSGRMIPQVGTLRFTAYAMSFSALGVIIHAYAVNGLRIWDFPSTVYMLALVMALISTVLPSFLISGGIRYIGSDNASIVASVGPISTIILANIFLGEIITISQMAGTFFVLLGVIMITIKTPLRINPLKMMSRKSQ